MTLIYALTTIQKKKAMSGGSDLNLTQGGIYLAKLNPTKPGEVGKVRPVIVLTNQIILDSNPPIIFICPLSSQSHKNFESLHIELPARDSLLKTSFALIEYCRAISHQRIEKHRLAELQRREIIEIIQRLNTLIDCE